MTNPISKATTTSLTRMDDGISWFQHMGLALDRLGDSATDCLSHLLVVIGHGHKKE